MSLSQKCQYAVRAVLELSKRYGQGAVPAGEIAVSQAIPRRFLEIILNEMKPAGLVDSRRGARGGYYLALPPDRISVGRVIQVIEGPLDPVKCTSDKEDVNCPLQGQCALMSLWTRAKEALEEVYGSVTFHELVEQEREIARKGSSDYCI